MNATDLASLLAETHDEVLQELWDRTLIQMWRAPFHSYMGKTMYIFVQDNNITYDKLNTLKRTPRYGKQFKTTVARYIAAYLPKLSDKLWDGKMSEDELVAWLSRSKIDTLITMADSHKAVKESKERKKIERSYTAQVMSQFGEMDYAAATNRSSWLTVKGKRR